MNSVLQPGMSGGNTLLMLNECDLEKAIEKVMMTFFEKVTQEMEAKKKDEVLLTEDEVKERLNVTHATLWRWNNAGYLRNIKVGRRCLWRESDIEKLLSR